MHDYRRTGELGQRKAFVRWCNVFLSRSSPAAVVVVCRNHGGLSAERPDGAVLVEDVDAEELGARVLDALAACTYEPAFDYRDRSDRSWPALTASGAIDRAAFERDWIRLQVRGANDTNSTWCIRGQVSEEFALTLEAAVAPTNDAARLGAALRFVYREVLRIS